MMKRIFFLFTLLLSTAASAWAGEEGKTELENVAAALSHQRLAVSTATEEIGLFRSNVNVQDCDVHWLSSDPDGSYITCHVSYEDKYFHGSGDVVVDTTQGQIALHLRWEKPSSYSVKLDLSLTRPANQITWSGYGELQAYYRFKVWNNKYWQVDLHGKANI